MSDISALADTARALAGSYAGCSREQALVYACEDVVEVHLGSREIAFDDAAAWLSTVCDAEGIDEPLVVRGRASRATLASADIDGHALCIRGSRTTTSTLVHELAHLTCGVGSHRALFLDELVRLTRAHVSVEHASLMHALFGACGMAVAPWGASASRR